MAIITIIYYNNLHNKVNRGWIKTSENRLDMLNKMYNAHWTDSVKVTFLFVSFQHQCSGRWWAHDKCTLLLLLSVTVVTLITHHSTRFISPITNNCNWAEPVALRFTQQADRWIIPDVYNLYAIRFRHPNPLAWKRIPAELLSVFAHSWSSTCSCDLLVVGYHSRALIDWHSLHSDPTTPFLKKDHLKCIKKRGWGSHRGVAFANGF